MLRQVSTSPVREIRGAGISVDPDSNELEEFGRLIDAKKIKVIVLEVFPLRNALKAQGQIATHHTSGKIVLEGADR